MADTLTLTGGNEATDKVVSYYNQLMQQLGGNVQKVTYGAISAPQQLQAQTIPDARKLQAREIQSPGQLSAQIIGDPTKLQAQEIAAPSIITPSKIEVEDQTQEGLAQQIAAYLRPYTENAIRQRQKQTVTDRAAADVDAASRGMIGSTWLSDAKNRMAAAEASDIAGIENEYMGNLLQQVFNSYQSYLGRKLSADTQNAANQLVADQQNAANALAVAQQNAANRMAADQFNIGNEISVADANAARQMQADQFKLQALVELAQQNEANRMAAEQFNIGNELGVAQQNAANQMAADQFNIANLIAIAQANAENQLEADMYNSDAQSQLMQVLMSYAQQLQGLEPEKTGGGGDVDNSGITYQTGTGKTIQQMYASSPLTQVQQSINDILSKVQNAAAGNDAKGTKATAKQNVRG